MKKAVHSEVCANVMVNRENLKGILLKSGMRKECPVSHSKWNKSRRRNERVVSKKREKSIISIWRWYSLLPYSRLYQRHLSLHYHFLQSWSTQNQHIKSETFLYVNNKFAEKKNLIHISPKYLNKHLGMNHVKYLHNKKFQRLNNEVNIAESQKTSHIHEQTLFPCFQNGYTAKSYLKIQFKMPKMLVLSFLIFNYTTDL